jgi:hypothetical protein
MSVSVFFIATAGAVVLLALVCASWIPLREERSLQLSENIELLFPLHTQHFSQLKHSLDSSDAQYVSRRGSKELQNGWRAERRRILKDYIHGLGGDFARVMLLRRMLNSQSGLSLQPDRSAWLRLALRFRLHYWAVSFCVLVRGTCTLRQLARLSTCVGSMAALAETAVASTGYRAVEGEAGTSSIA